MLMVVGGPESDALKHLGLVPEASNVLSHHIYPLNDHTSLSKWGDALSIEHDHVFGEDDCD